MRAAISDLVTAFSFNNCVNWGRRRFAAALGQVEKDNLETGIRTMIVNRVRAQVLGEDLGTRADLVDHQVAATGKVRDSSSS